MKTIGTVKMTSESTAPEPATATINPKVEAMEYAGAMLAEERIERSDSPRTRERRVRFNVRSCLRGSGRRQPATALRNHDGDCVAEATSGSYRAIPRATLRSFADGGLDDASRATA